MRRLPPGSGERLEGGRHTLDAKLAVGGGGTTTVEVTAEGGAQVNTTDAQISQVVSSAQILQLPTLNRNHIASIKVRFPRPVEQRAIAETLGALDDKIDLNRQMNHTLETMAQALFRSWFVFTVRPA